MQPTARDRSWELRAGDDVIATLRWQRQTLADAECADGRWTFKREGFWHPQVTARAAGSEQNAALFRPNWRGGGTLEIPESPPVHLAAANFWQSRWEWRQGDGGVLVVFKSRQGIAKVGGDVQISPAARSSADLGLLVLLGWYLIVLFAQDSAIAAASTTGIASS